LGLAISSGAEAKTPKEVLEPYKAYRAALKEGDKKNTSKYALEAWEAAEEHLGDHKTTGDLASNYTVTKDHGKNPYKNYKKRIKAHKRSIELAYFYDEDAQDIEIERRLKLAAYSLVLRTKKRSGYVEGGKGTYFDDVEKALDKYGKRGGTFEADLEVLRTQFYELRKIYAKPLEHSEKALKLYETRSDKIPTAYVYAVRLSRGNALNASEKPIDAALEYQHVMQNLEGIISSDHPFVSRAFSSWMRTRSNLEDAGRLDEAEAAGLCECWPYEDYKNKPVPLTRIPGVMPSRAKKSGHVIVMFDVDESGETYNVRKVSATDEIFVKNSLAAAEKFKYSKLELGADIDPKNRKDVTTKITYRLTDSRGNILPE